MVWQALGIYVNAGGDLADDGLTAASTVLFGRSFMGSDGASIRAGVPAREGRIWTWYGGTDVARDMDSRVRMAVSAADGWVRAALLQDGGHFENKPSGLAGFHTTVAAIRACRRRWRRANVRRRYRDVNVRSFFIRPPSLRCSESGLHLDRGTRRRNRISARTALRIDIQIRGVQTNSSFKFSMFDWLNVDTIVIQELQDRAASAYGIHSARQVSGSPIPYGQGPQLEIHYRRKPYGQRSDQFAGQSTRAEISGHEPGIGFRRAACRFRRRWPISFYGAPAGRSRAIRASITRSTCGTAIVSWRLRSSRPSARRKGRNGYD